MRKKDSKRKAKRERGSKEKEKKRGGEGIELSSVKWVGDRPVFEKPILSS